MSENLAHLLSGAGGGVIATGLTYPLLNLATRLQQLDTRKGALDSLMEMFRRDGIAPLYAGIGSALFGVAVTQGIFFYSYEATKAFAVKKLARNLTSLDGLVVGTFAGVITTVLTNPIWVVNTRVSTQSGGESKNAWRTLKDLLQDEGPSALFNGLFPALVLVSNPALQFMVFERLKPTAERLRRGQPLADLDHFLLGLVSKFVASTATYPYILVKTKMQARMKRRAKIESNGENSNRDRTRVGYGGNSNGRDESSAEMLREILRTEGVPGLFQGYGPRITQSVLTAALLFWAKERLFRSSTLLIIAIQIKWAQMRRGKK